ncbi:MAG TPA: hypothetical protein VH374_15520 [Polyangia bacterium]|jgi:hypothetical protein|nr:hypothetical protein [Polyangia bacterium]
MKRRVRTISKGGRALARVAVGSVSEIRKALTVDGDIRSEVAFQNDVNAILATVGKLTALGPATVVEEDVPISITPVPAAITPVPMAITPTLRRAPAGGRR